MGYGDRSCAFTEQHKEHRLNQHLVTDARQETVRVTRPKTKPKGHRDVQHWSQLNHVLPNAHSSQSETQLYIFEDNEAVINLIVQGMSDTETCVNNPRSCN